MTTTQGTTALPRTANIDIEVHKFRVRSGEREVWATESCDLHANEEARRILYGTQHALIVGLDVDGADAHVVHYDDPVALHRAIEVLQLALAGLDVLEGGSPGVRI